MSDSEPMVKVRVVARTDMVGSQSETVLEFTKEEWDEMPENERNDVCFETVTTDLIEWDYEEIK